MNPSRSFDGAEFSRNSPRWGEYEVMENGKDLRKSDGLSRFRNNFDCCHQVPVEGYSSEKFDGHMIPKPTDVDCSVVGDTKTYRTSSKAREATFEVFPQNVTSRTDEEGKFVLEEPTREAIDQMQRKIYCSSGYNSVYPETAGTDNLANSRSVCEARKPKRVRFADDIGYNLEVKLTPRQDYEAIIDPENWPRFENEADPSGPEAFCAYFGNTDNSKPGVSSYEYPYTVPIPPKNLLDGSRIKATDMDKNQNYHFLTSAIYNYQLPSALHNEDLSIIDLDFPTDKEKVKKVTHSIKKHERPLIPTKLVSEMKTVKEEMNMMEAKVPGIPRTIPLWSRSDLPCTINQWLDSAASEKLTLAGQSDLQKRYHEDHQESIPDLRNNKRYSKKVFFDGFNSSAYRG
ncbi:uncharacterized protein LOC133204010 [Saccostrea echinata]|uniref:uncharacterized protein LOC133204010 n=1 Tax=Saccostrea echinata TaxID=191078 RepID=UPI002A819592|nr:uncharacterized protein LOC133204010 [Saccostrea echinata]